MRCIAVFRRRFPTKTRTCDKRQRDLRWCPGCEKVQTAGDGKKVDASGSLHLYLLYHSYVLLSNASTDVTIAKHFVNYTVFLPILANPFYAKIQHILI